MVYTIRIPKKYFPKLRELCKYYNSYRECIIKEIEKKYNVKIYSSKKAHDSRLQDDLVPKPIYIYFDDEENERLKELAKKMGLSEYKIIMSVLR